MHGALTLVVTLTALALQLGGSRAFLFSSNCAVSTWSKWEGPVGFGGYQRVRTVLVPPSGRGKKCPTLVETKPGPAPTIRQVAKTLSDKFLRRSGQLKTRDLLIIVDSSGSIGAADFNKAKKNLAKLLSLLCPSPDPFHSSSVVYHQGAVINFSGNSVEVFDFNDKTPTSTLMTAVQNLHYFGGSTCTGKAFNMAKAMFQAGLAKGVRNSPHVQKEVLILTDGKSNCGPNAIAMATNLKNTVFSPQGDKANVFGLMIGSYSASGKQEVEQYVSTPVGNHLFAIPNFDQLGSLVNVVEQQAVPCAPIVWP